MKKHSKVAVLRAESRKLKTLNPKVSEELEELFGQIERGEVKSESGIFVLPSLSISQQEMDEAFSKIAAELGMTLQEAREAIERKVGIFKKKARDAMN